MLNERTYSWVAAAFLTCLGINVHSAPVSIPNGYTITRLPAQTINPSALAISPNAQYPGRIYMAEMGNPVGGGPNGDEAIYYLDSQGDVVPFAITGIGEPFGIKFDTMGNFGNKLYAVSGSTSEVFRIEPNGVSSVFATFPPLPGPFGRYDPFDIAFAPNGPYGGSMYVAALFKGIIKIDPDGSFRTFAVTPGVLPGAQGLAFDPTGGFGGGLFTLNFEDNTVLAVNSSGGMSVFTNINGLVGANQDITRLAFDPYGAFGNDLFVIAQGNESGAASDQIIRIDENSFASIFASGFDFDTSASGYMTFDTDGSMLITESTGLGSGGSVGNLYRISPVPVPATAYLFASALAALASLRRKATYFLSRPSCELV